MVRSPTGTAPEPVRISGCRWGWVTLISLSPLADHINAERKTDRRPKGGGQPSAPGIALSGVSVVASGSAATPKRLLRIAGRGPGVDRSPAAHPFIQQNALVRRRPRGRKACTITGSVLLLGVTSSSSAADRALLPEQRNTPWPLPAHPAF